MRGIITTNRISSIDGLKKRNPTFGTPLYTSEPSGLLMMTPGLGFSSLKAISSYMKTIMFSSFKPSFIKSW